MQSREYTSDMGRNAPDEQNDYFFDSPSNGQRAREQKRNAMRAAGLGWFSVGLGLAELVAPSAVSSLIGARSDAKSRATLRMMGLRELTNGVLILTQRKSAPWIWSRVAGDVVDLAMLGKAALRPGAAQTRLLATTAAVVGVTVLDAMAAWDFGSPTGESESDDRSVVVSKSLTINRPVDEVYTFWRDLTNQPSFMTHLSRVEVYGDRSRWYAEGPAGVEISWEAELTEDRPGEFISWRSLPGSSIETEGSVSFCDAPGQRGTEIHVEIRYEPPLGVTGLSLATLFGAIPEQKLEDDLRRLKQILETGEVVRSEASIHAGPHPARAASKPETERRRVDVEQKRVTL
ncbi:MAG: SRPBCC family protein [Myxococcota bacterium]